LRAWQNLTNGEFLNTSRPWQLLPQRRMSDNSSSPPLSDDMTSISITVHLHYHHTITISHVRIMPILYHYHCHITYGTFGKMTGYGMDRRGSIPGKDKIFVFSITSRQILEPTQPPIQRASRVKREGREADHSPLSKARQANDMLIQPVSFPVRQIHKTRLRPSDRADQGVGLLCCATFPQDVRVAFQRASPKSTA
jgi:hypothetical protein